MSNYWYNLTIISFYVGMGIWWMALNIVPEVLATSALLLLPEVYIPLILVLASPLLIFAAGAALKGMMVLGELTFYGAVVTIEVIGEALAVLGKGLYSLGKSLFRPCNQPLGQVERVRPRLRQQNYRLNQQSELATNINRQSDAERVQRGIALSLDPQNQVKNHEPVLLVNQGRRPPINPDYIKREAHWDKNDLESYLKCPHGGKVMSNPVITKDGVTYDKDQAKALLKDQPHVRNYVMKSLIEKYQEAKLESAQGNAKTDAPVKFKLKSYLKGPTTLEVMKNPVVSSDGHTYEWKAITKWMQEHKTSPLTREVLKGTFSTNNVLKAITKDFGHQPEQVAALAR